VRPNPDRLEQLSRWITLGAFAIAGVSYLAAPVMALAWRQLPFPGFLVDPSLVVNDRVGDGWSGKDSGMSASQLVTRIAAVPVSTTQEFTAALEGMSAGDTVTVFTRSQDGKVKLFPSVKLAPFSNQDFATLFWLPYVVGLAYLAIGVWVYWASGSTRPGRTLAFFCVCVAIAAGLLFDIMSTHTFRWLWTAALAFLGGALISLAMRFPVEWPPVKERPWLLAVPYIPSFVLTGWTWLAMSQVANPWALALPTQVSYRLTAFGCFFFLGVVFYQARSSPSRSIQRQARIVLLGSLLAFLPIVLWFAAPVVGLSFPFNNALFLPGLLLFPMTVATAILRYRLLELDTLVNRAIVYGALTAVLAGIFTAAVGLTQRLFVATTGQQSDSALVLTTLIVVAMATPLKDRLQKWVDRQFRQLPSTALLDFGDEVRSFVQFNDVGLLSQRLLDECARSLDAECGAVIQFDNGQPVIAHTFGEWRGMARVSVPLVYQDANYGLLMLGPRKANRPYKQRDVASLAEVANNVAHAIHVALGQTTLDTVDNTSAGSI
jgi:hypothetical protein